MSEQNENQGPAVITRDDGTQYTEHQFKLDANEIASRFRGAGEITYHLPVAVPGNVEATLANLRAFVSPDADFATVLADKFNGQGLRLDVQKRAKDLLGKNAKEDASIAGTQEAVLAFRLGQPRAKGERKAREGRVAQAEARTAQVANTALAMFQKLSRAHQREFGPNLVATGAISQEALDAALAG